jgi:iron-sulfur cluster assembly accessory protein
MRKLTDNIGLFVTAAALDKVHEILQDRQPPPLGVRIFVYQDVTGINYNMNFAEEIDPSDNILDIDGITFVADINSSIFLNNIIMDYMTIGSASGFVFQNNCNATSTSCLTCSGSCYGKKTI